MAHSEKSVGERARLSVSDGVGNGQLYNERNEKSSIGNCSRYALAINPRPMRSDVENKYGNGSDPVLVWQFENRLDNAIGTVARAYYVRRYTTVGASISGKMEI